MQTMAITQSVLPVYSECGHIVGFDKVESRQYRVTQKELDEIIRIENEGILVHVVLPKSRKRDLA